MKLLSIFVIFTLSVVVHGWVAILQPIFLSLGAAFTALNIDTGLLPDIQLPSFKMDKNKKTLDSIEDAKELFSSRKPELWRKDEDELDNYIKDVDESFLEKRRKAKADPNRRNKFMELMKEAVRQNEEDSKGDSENTAENDADKIEKVSFSFDNDY